MERRGFLGAMATIPLAGLSPAVQRAVKENPGSAVEWDGDKAFVRVVTSEPLKAGDVVCSHGDFLGLCCDKAAPGEWVKVQVYGHYAKDLP